MKKQILLMTTTIALTALVSCGGPKADKIGVQSELTPIKSTSRFQVDKEFETTINDASIITFPAGNDLDGYEYIFDGLDDDDNDLWNKIMLRLGYGKLLIREWRKSETSFDKIARIAATMLSLGKLKNESYKGLKKAEYGLEMTEQAVQPKIKQILSQFVCFPLLENKKKCKLIADETTLVKKSKKLKKCSKIRRRLKSYVDLSVEENDNFILLKKQCSGLTKKITNIKGIIESVEGIREDGKNLGFALADDYGKFANFTAAIEVAVDEEDTSYIVFNNDKTKIESFSLGLDFDGGVKQFSIENGGISNLVYNVTKQGSRFITMTINGPYRVDASLSVTSQSIELMENGPFHTNIRFTGTTVNTFPNGKVRKGVIFFQVGTVD